jgi:small subunit ribosomal protein S17
VIDKIHNKKMEKNKIKVGKEKILAGVVKNSDCKDRNCHIHGNLKVRGRIFEGKVTKKFHKRITIEFERMIYVRKYERYKKSKTKIHARLPICMEKDIQVGDLIKIQECRPLSKIIHFVVIEKINKEKGK